MTGVLLRALPEPWGRNASSQHPHLLLPPPHPFEMPSKSATLFYDSRTAFGTQRPSSCGGRRKPLSEISRSISTPSSTTCNSTPSSDYCMSPTPQTSLPNSAGGSKKKKAKSDILQEVDHIQDEIESLHSDTMSLHGNKYQCFLAKLDVKSEHNRDSKKYEWLRGACEHEASQATVSHQCLQEKQDAEIRLRKTDIRVHEAHSLVLNKEAETLQLEIQFHQMTQGNRTPASDGAV
ncbi:hypothetical protein DFJ58DRAFT_733340 [Suillus subalutaceus]|uniref:uncharacterized protein n=1 Tax=Suillus subalutaceus TaxID=48586 RepID=UPI001B8663FA|nr:uncharacterized protein DFJ58DRAFT_733340 [Suillus subalutaceus]KAG1839464.1 hypothetical protein DFJ58DRAFT_733340 [Suillus subalutaceus]